MNRSGRDDPNDTTKWLETRVLAGDEDALGRLFETFRARLLRVVQARMHPSLVGRIDPADVLQEAYLDLSKRLPNFINRDQTMGVFVWIRLVVKERLLITHRRHLFTQARDARREVTPTPSMDDSAPDLLANCFVQRMTSVSGKMMRAELATALLQMLQRMDPADREIITLRVFEELSNAEAAEVIGLSSNGASSRFVRAMTRLKRSLDSLPEVNDYMTQILGNR